MIVFWFGRDYGSPDIFNKQHNQQKSFTKMAIISKIDDLLILMAAFESGSFSAAAKALDLPVAKVTRAIQRLEKKFNVTLFNRTTRRISVTEEGHYFIEQVRPALTQLEFAEDALKSFNSKPQGRLRVDAASPFIFHQIVPLLSGFREAYPGICLELVSSEKVIDLIEKRTDIAIRIGKLKDSNLHAKFLGQSRIRLMASPSYIQQHGMPNRPEDISQHQTVGFTDSPALNQWPIGSGLHVPYDIAASSGESVYQLCLAGHGIAVLSDFMTHQARASETLIEVLPNTLTTPNDREMIHAVYYRHSALSARISAFIEYIAPRLKL